MWAVQQQEQVNDRAPCTCMLLHLIFALKNTHVTLPQWRSSHMWQTCSWARVCAMQRPSGIVCLLWCDNTALKSFVCACVCETILDTQAQKVTHNITQTCATNATWHILTGAHCRAGWWAKPVLVCHHLCCSDRAQREGRNRVRFSLYRLVVGVNSTASLLNARLSEVLSLPEQWRAGQLHSLD